MMQRLLSSKGLVAYVLASATGLTLYFRCPFPAHDLVLRLIALRQPLIYEGLHFSYTLFLFTTPYIAYRVRLSDGDFSRFGGPVQAGDSGGCQIAAYNG